MFIGGPSKENKTKLTDRSSEPQPNCPPRPPGSPTIPRTAARTQTWTRQIHQTPKLPDPSPLPRTTDSEWQQPMSLDDPVTVHWVSGWVHQGYQGY